MKNERHAELALPHVAGNIQHPISDKAAGATERLSKNAIQPAIRIQGLFSLLDVAA
jgi:hypothetical protein